MSRERRGSGPVGDVERLAEELSRVRSLIASSKHCAEVGERTSALQARAGILECVDCRAEQNLPAPSSGHEACGSLRDAKGARGAEGPCELELVVRKAPGVVPLSECELGERSIGSPREEARGDDPSPNQQGSDRQKVPQAFGGAPLFEAQSAAGEAKERRVERWTICLGVDCGERFLGRGELTLIREGLNEQTGLEDAVDRRGGKLGRRQRGSAVDLSGAQVTASERQPPAMRQAGGEPSAVTRCPSFGDGLVEQWP
jgi:hypothetical protein